jgi:hypothetical protein
MLITPQQIFQLEADERIDDDTCQAALWGDETAIARCASELSTDITVVIAAPVRPRTTTTVITRTPEQWEALAIHYKADLGLVPYPVWIRLSPDSQKLLGKMDQEKAQRTAVGSRPRLPTKQATTVDELKRLLLAHLDRAETSVNQGEVVIPGYRDAVLALPDRKLIATLPADVRSFLERELDTIEAQHVPI